MKSEQKLRQLAQNQLILLGLILTTAVILRLIATFLFDWSANLTGYSESGVVAQNLVNGDGFVYDFYGTRPDNPLVAFIPPVYASIIAACLWLFGDSALLALLGVQSVLAGGTAVFAFFIGSKLSGDERLGWLVAMATAFYPVYILMSLTPQSLTINAFLLAWLLLGMILVAERPSVGRAVFAGLGMGLALLARPMLLGFLPLLLLWALLNGKVGKRLVGMVSITAVVALLTLSPWLLRNYQLLGQPTLLTGGGFNYWNGNNPFTTGSGHELFTAKLAAYRGEPHDASQPAVLQLQPYPLPPELAGRLGTIDELTLSRELYAAGIQFAVEQPEAWGSLLWIKLKGFVWLRDNVGRAYDAGWQPYYQPVYGLLLLAALVGMGVAVRQWRRYALLYGLLGYYMVVYTTFQVQTRFRWEVEAYLLLFGGVTALFVWDWVRQPRRAATNAPARNLPASSRR